MQKMFACYMRARSGYIAPIHYVSNVAKVDVPILRINPSQSKKQENIFLAWSCYAPCQLRNRIRLPHFLHTERIVLDACGTSTSLSPLFISNAAKQQYNREQSETNNTGAVQHIAEQQGSKVHKFTTARQNSLQAPSAKNNDSRRHC